MLVYHLKAGFVQIIKKRSLNMINISSEAIQMLKEFKERKGPDSYVRIGIVSGTTSGSSLGVVVDEKTEKDTVCSFEGLEVIVDSALLQYCEEISVEYIQQESAACGGGGFRIVPQNSL
jgi:Fe-S cluster assembly iron-binding protein IscA